MLAIALFFKIIFGYLFYTFDFSTNESPEEAVNIRFLKKSLTMYSIFDWSKVPRLEARRQTDSQFSLPRILTFVYR